MKLLLNKEWRLASLLLTKLFILFGVLAMVPGYPILLGVFFTALGIFQSFQSMRENNDILYSALLPIAKRDIVSAKFLFCLIIEGGSFALMMVATVLRMTVFADSPIYRANALMNANLCFLGFALLGFALFNLVFIRGFFRTGYYFGKPFIGYIVVSMLLTAVAEAAHYFPGFAWINSFGTDHIAKQIVFFAVCALIAAAVTAFARKRSQRDFERIDL